MENGKKHYSVLLVDDEEEVIRIIMKKLDWESMGLTIIGHAANGVEALEMAEELSPDIVMTDIKMPYMDGLTLCRKLKELSRTIRVIIFSGFDEFEYAKEAIKMEAEEYLLKPVNAGELKEVFERVKSDLDRERDEKRDTEKLRSYYMESLPVLQESFYMALLEGRVAPKQIKRYMDTYQISLPGPYYVVTVLHISQQALEEEEQMDPFLLALSVRRFAEEQADKRWRSRFVIYLGDIIMISQISEKEEILEYTNEMDRLCRMTRKVCNARVTAGVGYLCNSLEQLQLSYQGAKQAVSYRVLYGNTRAISISEVEPTESTERDWEDAYSGYIQRLMKKVRIGEVDGLEDAISQFIAWLSNSCLSLQQYRIVMMELITELFRFTAGHELNPETIFGAGDVYSQVLQMESTEVLDRWLRNVCANLQKAVMHERQDSTKLFVKNAEEYVQEHYADQDLSVEVICRKLNVSAAYFSTIFKKETGKTFVRYLTDYRMEKAVSLLMTGNDKTYVIAEKVGYAEPNYFSYVFKKQFGVSPSKYRAGRLEQK